MAKGRHDSRKGGLAAERVNGPGAEPRKRRTDEDLVSQKRLLMNHSGVYLDEAPVLGVAKRLDRDLDRRRVEDPADGAQPRSGAELGGLGVKCVQLVYPIRRLVHLAGDLVVPRSRQVPLELAVPAFQTPMSRESLAISAIMSEMALVYPPVPSATMYSLGWLLLVRFVPLLSGKARGGRTAWAHVSKAMSLVSLPRRK